MSKSSGFVPIRFKVAGQILIALGAAGLLSFLISWLTDWFFVDWVIGLAGLAMILIGLYLVYVVPVEPME